LILPSVRCLAVARLKSGDTEQCSFEVGHADGGVQRHSYEVPLFADRYGQTLLEPCPCPCHEDRVRHVGEPCECARA
jgi:hypothetical protein